MESPKLTKLPPSRKTLMEAALLSWLEYAKEATTGNMVDRKDLDRLFCGALTSTALAFATTEARDE